MAACDTTEPTRPPTHTHPHTLSDGYKHVRFEPCGTMHTP